MTGLGPLLNRPLNDGVARVNACPCEQLKLSWRVHAENAAIAEDNRQPITRAFVDKVKVEWNYESFPTSYFTSSRVRVSVRQNQQPFRSRGSASIA